MQEIIKLIVETDKASRRDIENALKHREEVTYQLSQAKEQIDAQYKKEADDKITKARIVAEKEASNFREDLSSLEKKKSEKLLKQFEDNHEAWENEIFKNVVGK